MHFERSEAASAVNSDVWWGSPSQGTPKPGGELIDRLDVTRAYPCTEASRAAAGENRAKRHRDRHLRTVTLSSDTGTAI